MASQPLTPTALRALMHDHPDVVQIMSAPAFGQENEDDMMKGAATCSSCNRQNNYSNQLTLETYNRCRRAHANVSFGRPLFSDGCQS